MIGYTLDTDADPQGRANKKCREQPGRKFFIALIRQTSIRFRACVYAASASFRFVTRTILNIRENYTPGVSRGVIQTLRQWIRKLILNEKYCVGAGLSFNENSGKIYFFNMTKF